MRILVVAACPLPWPRGTPIRVHRMAEALHERGHEVHVVTYPLGHPDFHVPYVMHRVGRPDMRLAPRPGPSLKKLAVLDPLLTWKTGSLLRQGNFDVIHAHHYEGLIAALLARPGAKSVPVVYDAHTLLASELPYYRLAISRRFSARIGLVLDRQLPRRADHIIAVTARMQEWFSGVPRVAADRISLIPNGVEHEHFSVHDLHPSDAGTPSSSDANRSPTAADRADESRLVRIVFTGNLAEYQGIDLLLHAFRQVRSRLPHAVLSLVTDSEAGHLRSQIDALGLSGSVVTIGADYASLPARLAEADVLVNPRPSCEGIPQKLLNYMAAGRPIVSFAQSAALLEHDRTALLVAEGDIAGFAKAILLILGQPQLGRRLAQAARDQVVATYGWQHVAAKVEDVYTHVTGKLR